MVLKYADESHVHTCFLSHGPGKGNRVIIGTRGPWKKDSDIFVQGAECPNARVPGLPSESA